jgi:cytochrome P450
VRVMLGADIPVSVSRRWVELIREAEPDKAFSGSQGNLSKVVEICLKRERSIYEETRQLIYPYLDAEIEKAIANEPEAEDASVMSTFVRQWWGKIRDADSMKRARRRMANDLFFFTFAAVTNSYSAAAWVLFHVIRNTNGTGDRIQQELATLAVDADSLPELEKTIYEIGRLYTPGATFRLLLQPWTMPSTGETLPAGSGVYVSTSECHRSTEGFTQPLEFDLSRYDREEDRQAGCLFVPFGAGLHPCVGKRLAVLEIAMFAAEALRQFDWSLVDDETRPEDPFTQSMIHVPRHPALDPKQTNSIWRPDVPVLAHYERIKKHD